MVMIKQAGEISLFHVQTSERKYPGASERKFERDSEITEPDRQNRKKKMVTAYAAKEQKRYHEKSKLMKNQWKTFWKRLKIRRKGTDLKNRKIKPPSFA
ncbi:MAG: hypothetical protein ACLVG5_05560 [Clostridium sp.]